MTVKYGNPKITPERLFLDRPLNGYILGISRGHNAGVCLMKDGEIVFAQEEERFTRIKYDGTPLAGMVKVLDYTDKIDMMFVSYTMPLTSAPQTDYTGEDYYTSMARKLKLIEPAPFNSFYNIGEHPQVVDLAHSHHKIHAAGAFYRSGFKEACAVVVDGSGSARRFELGRKDAMEVGVYWETESIFDCKYPADFTTVHKSWGTSDNLPYSYEPKLNSALVGEPGKTHEAIYKNSPGLVKIYEAVTELAGWQGIEAGKTMGLAPYGKPNPDLPPMIVRDRYTNPIVNNNLFTPQYPQSSKYNVLMSQQCYEQKGKMVEVEKGYDIPMVQDLAYQVQKETQEAVFEIILKAVEMTGQKNVVLSGGYGLNCVANYKYQQKLQDSNINLFVDAIASDAGTHVAAAMWGHAMEYSLLNHNPSWSGIYMGPEYDYSKKDVKALLSTTGTVTNATNEDIVDLITSKNIVTFFNGRSELGPRALGNRSILYDPTDPDGKDFVNTVKKREFFRPFAGSILEEDAAEWFDMSGLKSSPHMMYAMKCQPGVEKKIPSIIHEDGTCRIQTVNREQNPNYYDLIKAFKDKTGCPIVFNTSFNLGGEPLVETLEDAINTLRSSDIDYLFLPELGLLVNQPRDEETDRFLSAESNGWIRNTDKLPTLKHSVEDNSVRQSSPV